MEMTEFSGPLTVNFLDGKFVGWFLEGSDETYPVMLSKNVGLANTFGDLKVVYNAWMVRDSTLGNEFFTSAGIGGFLDERNVGIEALYAGTNCFFR